MHLDITPEVILSQLGYSHSVTAEQQVMAAIKNTKGFDKFAKHIISLNDFLQHVNGYVALSNSKNCFKIKCDNHDAPEILEEFHNEVDHWSKKYHVEIQKVKDKEVYYIIGIAE